MKLPPAYRRFVRGAMLTLGASTGMVLTTATGCSDAVVTAGVSAVRDLSLDLIQLGFDAFIADRFGTADQVTVRAVTDTLTRLIA